MAQKVDIYALISEKLGCEHKNPEDLSSLALAFIGDAVYELVLRSKVISDFNRSVKELNYFGSALAKAPTQSEIIKKLIEEEMLSERELAIFKRGRNAKSNTSAKNATIGEYRDATGFEALIGHLYLEGNTDRIIELSDYGFNFVIAKHGNPKDIKNKE